MQLSPAVDLKCANATKTHITPQVLVLAHLKSSVAIHLGEKSLLQMCPGVQKRLLMMRLVVINFGDIVLTGCKPPCDYTDSCLYKISWILPRLPSFLKL